ncbi:MAG: sulfur carrier protein ThiS [Actinomycetota bacterium]|nr:sulfur carrier protein ThiS [Actinomycetota bacterium]
MKVKLNGRDAVVEDGTTVRAVVEAQTHNGLRTGIAVAINGEVVSRSNWDDTELTNGDRVEVLGAIGGGAERRARWMIR